MFGHECSWNSKITPYGFKKTGSREIQHRRCHTIRTHRRKRYNYSCLIQHGPRLNLIQPIFSCHTQTIPQTNTWRTPEWPSTKRTKKAMKRKCTNSLRKSCAWKDNAAGHQIETILALAGHGSNTRAATANEKALQRGQ